MEFSSILCASFALTTSAFAGQVRVVGPSPAQYATVQSTLDAALDGDVVLVKAGSYPSFRTADRSVSIVAESGQIVTIQGAIRVIGLSSTRRVLVSGLSSIVTGVVGSAEMNSGLYLESNAGQVVVQDGTFTTFTNASTASGAFMRDCSGVSLVRTISRSTAFGRPGVSITTNASVDMQTSEARGAVGTAGAEPLSTFSIDGGNAGHGLEYLANSASFLFQSGCMNVGGKGGQGGYTGGLAGTQCGCPGRGGDGLLGQTIAGQLVLLATTSIGGAGGSTSTSAPGGCSGTPNGPPGHAIYLGPESWCTGSLVTPATQYATIAGSSRRLDGTKLVRDGGVFTLDFAGSPLELVDITLTRAQPGFQYQPANGGVLHVPNPIWIRMGDVPPAGTLSRSFLMRELAIEDPTVTYLFQARFNDQSTGQTRLSNEHALVAIDSSY